MVLGISAHMWWDNSLEEHARVALEAKVARLLRRLRKWIKDVTVKWDLGWTPRFESLALALEYKDKAMRRS